MVLDHSASKELKSSVMIVLSGERIPKTLPWGQPEPPNMTLEMLTCLIRFGSGELGAAAANPKVVRAAKRAVKKRMMIVLFCTGDRYDSK